MNRSLTSGFLSLVSAKLATSLITIVSLPLIIRVLGAGDYGDYAFLISTFSLLMILISSGVTEGVQKFAAEERDDPQWQAYVIGFYLKLALVLAVGGAIILALITAEGTLPALYGADFTLYFYLLAAFVIAAQFRSFSRRTMMAFGWERYSEPLRIFGKLVWVGLGLALALQGLGVTAFLLSNIVAASLVAIGGFVLIFRRTSIRAVVSKRPTSFPTRKLLSFNALNIVLVLLLMSLFHVDVIMVRTLLSDQATGFYKGALALAEYIWFVPLSLQTLLLHSTSNDWIEDRTGRLTDLSTRITRYVLLFTGLLAIGLFVLAGRVLPLYFGGPFAAAEVALLFLLPGSIGFALARPLYAINQSSGRLTPLIAATGVAAIMNGLLNVVLIPQYGIAGAAAATSIGYGSMFVLHVGCARWLGYNPLVDIRFTRCLATIGVTLPILWIIDQSIDGDLIALLVVPPIGALLFTALALLTGAIDRQEIRDIVGSLPQPIARPIQRFLPGA